MNRVGAVSYSYQYSIGLFSYNERPGERMDVFGFVSATREAGGEVAQAFHTMLHGLDADDLARLQAHAADLDVALEIHGGAAQRDDFETTLQQAAALGVTVVGCSFGMLTRPDKIGTLAEWDEHLDACRTRYDQLLSAAAPLGISLGIENHLDFTVSELRDLVEGADSPNAGVMLDVGNTIGTLDDPVEAGEILGPYTIATHYKDFAIEEVTRGFRFTMVPLGAGSLDLPAITAQLLQHIGPEVNLAIEMMNGQQFEVKWLEDRFWEPYRDKPAREVAATLRHIRGKAIDIDEFLPVDEVDKLDHKAHLALEQTRIEECIGHLKGLVG
jgi:sugar phosphate isomerase/epimerase